MDVPAYRIVIEATGPVGYPQYAGNAEEVAADFAQRLREVGHAVTLAEFTAPGLSMGFPNLRELNAPTVIEG